MKKMLPLIAIVVAVVALVGWLLVRRSHNQQSPSSLPAEKTAVTQEGLVTPTPTATQQQKTVVAQDEKVHQPLTLTISSPASGATVTNPAITVKGKTAASAEVFVNEKEGKADASGNFSIGITLDEGENYMVILANDANGNVAEKELTITYDSGQ